MAPPKQDINAPAKLAAPTHVTKEFRSFWVRYFKRDNGNLVYQFFAYDPALLDTFGVRHNASAFDPRFKDILIKVFSKHIPIPEKLDIAFVGDYEGVPLNSFSVCSKMYSPITRPVLTRSSRSHPPSYCRNGCRAWSANLFRQRYPRKDWNSKSTSALNLPDAFRRTSWKRF